MAGLTVQQGRLSACLFLFAAMLLPAASSAQDVIVLPPSTATAVSNPTATDAAESAASTDNAPLLARELTPVTTTQSAVTVTASPAAPTPTANATAAPADPVAAAIAQTAAAPKFDPSFEHGVRY